MVELAIVLNDHWYDKIPANDQIILNSNGKFNTRIRRGDIAEVKPGTFFSDQKNWKFDKFAIIRIIDVEINQAIDYMARYERKVNFQRTLNDPGNGVYEYRVEIINASPGGFGSFTDLDSFPGLPADMEILSKTGTVIILRLTTNNPARVLKVHAAGKDLFDEFKSVVMQRIFSIDINLIPNSWKQAALNGIVIETTKSEILPFIIDRRSI